MVAAPALPPITMAPHSQEAEEAVLGAPIINPAVFEGLNKFLEPDDFFILRNAWVFEAMQRLHARQEPIDYLTVSQELKAQGRHLDAGGDAFLTYLVSNIPTTSHTSTYGWMVSRFSYRRRALDLAEEIAVLARDESKPFSELMPVILEKTTTLANKFAKKQRVLTGSQQKGLAALLCEFEDFIETGDPEMPIPTGINVLDNTLMGGLFKGWLVVLASRMKVGKTRLKVTLALNAATSGKQVVFYTTEEKREGIMRKMITMLTGVSETRLRLKKYSPIEKAAIQDAIHYLKGLNIQIYEATSWTIPQLRLHYIDEHVETHGHADVLFADYIQRFEEHRKGYADKEHTVFGKIAQDLKNIANDFGLLVVTSSQYNRVGANGNGANDTLAGSDQIAREADLVIGIDRPETYESHVDKKRPNQADLKITASRHDDLTGREVTIGFNKKGGWFCDMPQIELEPRLLQNAKVRAMRTGMIVG